MLTLAMKLENGEWFKGFSPSGRAQSTVALNEAYLFSMENEADAVNTVQRIPGAEIYRVSLSVICLHTKSCDLRTDGPVSKLDLGKRCPGPATEPQISACGRGILSYAVQNDGRFSVDDFVKEYPKVSREEVFEALDDLIDDGRMEYGIRPESPYQITEAGKSLVVTEDPTGTITST